MSGWVAKKMKRSAPVELPTFCLAVEIDGNWLYWMWKKGHVPTPCDKPSTESVWRVSGYDYLSPVQSRSKKFLIKQGRDFLRKKSTWVFYGEHVSFTPLGQECVMGVPSRPITASMSETLKGTPSPALLSMALPGDMVAFAAIKRKGEVSGWTVASLEDAEIIGVRLAQNEGIVDAQKVALPCVQELVERSGPARDYPIESEWAGTPVRIIRRGFLGASFGLAVLVSFFWLTGQGRVDHARQRYALSQQSLMTSQKKVAAWNRLHVDYVVKKSGINIRSLMDTVSSLSMPGSRASITDGGNQIIVYLPKRGFGALVPGEWSSQRAIAYGLKRPVPPGWKLTSLARSGSQGQYVLVYNRRGLR